MQTSDSVALKVMGFVETPAHSKVKVAMLLLPLVTSATVTLVPSLNTPYLRGLKSPVVKKVKHDWYVKINLNKDPAYMFV